MGVVSKKHRFDLGTVTALVWEPGDFTRPLYRPRFPSHPSWLRARLRLPFDTRPSGRPLVFELRSRVGLYPPVVVGWGGIVLLIRLCLSAPWSGLYRIGVVNFDIHSMGQELVSVQPFGSESLVSVFSSTSQLQLVMHRS